MAYVDADLVIHSMSEYQVVNMELEKYQAKLVQKLEAEKKSIAVFYTDVIDEVKKGVLSPKEQENAQKELQEKQVKLEELKESIDILLLQKEKELSHPLYLKFEAILKKVAQDKKIDLILDKKFLHFGSQKKDLTNLVLKYINS